MKTPAPALMPIFRSDAQGRLLALLLDDVTREWSQAELARRARVTQPTASRELARLVTAGLLNEWRQGNTLLYRANDGHPFHRDLTRILSATFGVPAILTRAFDTIANVDALIVFGSWAARHAGVEGPPPNDIDVLVIGSPDRDTVYAAAEAAEDRIGRPVQTTIRRLAAWQSSDDAFLNTLRGRPFLVLAGSVEARRRGVEPTLEGPA